MPQTKKKIAVAVLGIAVVALTALLIWIRVGGWRPMMLGAALFEGEPEPMSQENLKIRPAGEFGPEVKGLQARVSLYKEKYKVGDVIDAHYVVKNASGKDQVILKGAFWTNHQVFVRDADGKEPPLSDWGKQGRTAFDSGGPRTTITRLNIPPGGEDRERDLDLAKLFDYKPGRYTVQYIYEDKHDGWQGRLASNAEAFEVVERKAADLAASEPKNAEGLDFQVVIEKKVPIPTPKTTEYFEVGLRLTNRTDKLVAFNLFDTLVPVLASADGKTYKLTGGRDGTKPPKPLSIAPGKTETVTRRGMLAWFPKPDILSVNIPDGAGGGLGFEGLKPGRYRLRFKVENTQKHLDDFLRFHPVKDLDAKSFWVGNANTNEVEFELVVGDE